MRLIVKNLHMKHGGIRFQKYRIQQYPNVEDKNMIADISHAVRKSEASPKRMKLRRAYDVAQLLKATTQLLLNAHVTPRRQS